MFSATTDSINITIPCHSDKPWSMSEKIYCSMALQWQAGHSKLNTEKSQTFLVDFDRSTGMLQVLWATLVILGYMYKFFTYSQAVVE
jgi:hypothetical protein